MCGLVSQSFRLGGVAWARRASGCVPRFDLSMLIISYSFSICTSINTLLAALQLLLVHWLDVRTLGLVRFLS